MEIKELIEKAMEARKNAYTPYSNFKVGAALVTKSGKVYTGCNIENAGYTPSNCAERTAFFKAVSEGEREFERIVIVAGKDGEDLSFAAPCGVCRQVMMEFCDPKTFEITMAEGVDKYATYTLEQILPFGFGPKNLL